MVILLFPLDRQSSSSWPQISAASGTPGAGVRAEENTQLDMLPMHPSGNCAEGERENGGFIGYNTGKSDLEHRDRLRQ